MSYNPLLNNHIYQNDDPSFHQSTGYVTPARPAKRTGTSNWIKFGIPVAVLVIAGAVVGGILGSRKSRSSSVAAAASSSAAAAAAAAGSAGGREVLATGTNTWFLPEYPSTTNTALYTVPTISSAAPGWPSDPFAPSNPSVLSVRPDRPRLIAPAYKWAALPDLIGTDPYLHLWNASIFKNASEWDALPAVVYFMDGDSGILDVARQVKQRVKAFGYVYRMTNNTHWVDRTWEELQNAAGNGTNTWGPSVDRWNSAHFLDTAELSAAYGIAYDWLYDLWTEDQKSMIRSTLIEYGLGPGVQAYTNSSVFTGWWANNIQGNWNCVCNNGLTMAALAILGDDTIGFASQLLGLTVDNAKENCAFGVSSDGTWSETADYWYFGATGHAEMAASLQSATGSDFGLLTVNPNFYKTGIFHMYGQGTTQLFAWGDNGPNKYTATANSLLYYAQQYGQPEYALFQRDQFDAADPWSMFWYDPRTAGAVWDGLPLDHAFDNETDQWMSMRSSWTDQNALFVAIKAGTLQGHQTHNDLDVGDFVLDALGTRWAGELGDGDYLSPDYFSNDTQGSARWMYYRKMTEGQNTILVGATNQDVSAKPTMLYGTSNTTQGSSTVFTPDSNSTAYFVTDMTSAYFNAASVKRGIRLLNGRKQVLLQDEITASQNIMWRMHTNATVSASGTSATLTRDGKSMNVTILNAPDGAAFTTSNATRLNTDVTPPAPDQPNPGITVLIISLPAGTVTLQVLFDPQWNDGTTMVTPPSVALNDWTLESHD